MTWVSMIVAGIAVLSGIVSFLGFLVQGKVGEAFAIPVLVAVAVMLQFHFEELRSKP